MEKFYSPEFLLGVGLSFRDNAMKCVMLSHFPASSPSPPQHVDLGWYQEHGGIEEEEPKVN